VRFDLINADHIPWHAAQEHGHADDPCPGIRNVAASCDWLCKVPQHAAIPSSPAAGAADQMSLAPPQRGPTAFESLVDGACSMACDAMPPPRPSWTVRFTRHRRYSHALILTPLPLGNTTSSSSVACGRKSSTTRLVGTRQTFAALGGDPVPWSNY
jgi:hypothetical protein